MFEKFDNLPSDYIPDNMHPRIPSFEIAIRNGNLAPMYNVWGCETGYEFDYGENVNIEVTSNFNITVDSNSIIFTEAGQAPTEETVGELHQKCYNTVDLKSWTFSHTNDGSYIWNEDEELTYPSTGAKVLEMTPSMIGKKLEVVFYDHRNEFIYQESFEEVNTATVVITNEMSEELFKRGLYRMEVHEISEHTYTTIIKTNIHVK